MDKCPKQNQGYKDTHLSEKMDTCPIVELGVLGAHLKKKKKKKRESEKKRNKKMIAHGPSNKHYASKR